MTQEEKNESYSHANAHAMMDQSWAECEAHIEDIARIAMEGPTKEEDITIMHACCCFVAAKVLLQMKDREREENENKNLD